MKFSPKQLSILFLVLLPIVLFVAIIKVMPPRPVPLPESDTGVLAFSFDGKKVAAGGMGKTSSDAKIWDTSSHQLELTIQTKATVTKAVAFSPDGTKLATGAQGDTWPGETLGVSIWDTRSGQLVKKIAHKRGELGARSLIFSPDGTTLYGAKHDKIYLWDVTKGYQVKNTIQGEEPIYSMDCKADVIAFGDNKGITAYNLNTKKQLPTPFISWGPTYAVSLSADGTIGAAGGENKKVVVWDVQTGQEKITISSPHGGNIFAVALSPDGKTVVSSGSDGVYIWEVATGTMQRDLGKASLWGQGAYVAFSPDGSQLAISLRGSMDGRDAIQLLAMPVQDSVAQPPVAGKTRKSPVTVNTVKPNPGSENGQFTPTKRVLKKYDPNDWMLAEWAFNDEPYEKLRNEIDALSQDELMAYVEAGEGSYNRDLDNELHLYAWAYASYRAHSRNLPESYNHWAESYRELINEGMTWRSYENARLRFLVTKPYTRERSYQQLALRLIKHNPQGDEIKFQFLSLVDFKNPQGKKTAIQFIKELRISSPQNYSIYTGEGTFYGILWNTEKKPEYGHKAISAYKEYLRRAPADAPLRYNAQMLIKSFERSMKKAESSKPKQQNKQ